MAQYSKFIIALVGVIALGLQQFFQIGDGTTLFGLTGDQVANVVIGIAAAAGVYAVPNKTASDAAK